MAVSCRGLCLGRGGEADRGETQREGDTVWLWRCYKTIVDYAVSQGRI